MEAALKSAMVKDFRNGTIEVDGEIYIVDRKYQCELMGLKDKILFLRIKLGATFIGGILLFALTVAIAKP